MSIPMLPGSNGGGGMQGLGQGQGGVGSGTSPLEVSTPRVGSAHPQWGAGAGGGAGVGGGQGGAGGQGGHGFGMSKTPTKNSPLASRGGVFGQAQQQQQQQQQGQHGQQQQGQGQGMMGGWGGRKNSVVHSTIEESPGSGHSPNLGAAVPTANVNVLPSNSHSPPNENANASGG